MKFHIHDKESTDFPIATPGTSDAVLTNLHLEVKVLEREDKNLKEQQSSPTQALQLAILGRSDQWPGERNWVYCGTQHELVQFAQAVLHRFEPSPDPLGQVNLTLHQILKILKRISGNQ